LNTAKRALVQVGGMTGADLKVSDDGDITYKFDSDFREKMNRNSFKAKLASYYNSNKSLIQHYGKVAFGLTLIASLVVVSTALVVISSSSSSDDDRRDDRRRNPGGGMGMGNVLGPSPFDFWYYRPYRSYYVYGQPVRKKERGGGFLESVFSYVFGDGDPNRDMEELRIRGAAKLIRDAGGAVTAEQLAPFADIGDDVALGSEQTYVDESFVVPIMSQLGGRPEVTEDGDIIYVFDELMETGLSREAQIKLMGVKTTTEYEEAMAMREGVEIPNEINEVPLTFSSASDGNKLLAGVFGVINLAGVLYLGQILGSPAMQTVQLGSYLGAVKLFMPFLFTYAIAFNAIPLFRAFRMKSANAKINQRNKTRRLWRSVLENGGEKVQRKLRAAKKFAVGMKSVSRKKEVFDSGKDLVESQEERERRELEEFDRKFRQ